MCHVCGAIHILNYLLPNQLTHLPAGFQSMYETLANIHCKMSIPGKCSTLSYIHMLLLPPRIRWIGFQIHFCQLYLLL